MGIYSNSRFGNNTTVLDIPKGYDNGIYSLQVAMIENAQNQMAIFEGVLLSDMEQAIMEHNNVYQGEIIAFSENVLTDLIDKIKSFLKKAWEKIKAVLRGWIAKFENVFSKSNKDFVNKYKKEIMAKDLTDMKVKYRKRKNADKIEITNPAITKMLNENLDVGEWMKKDVQKVLENWDEEDESDKVCAAIIPQSTYSEYEKDFIDYFFEDEEEDDEVGNRVVSEIMPELLNHHQLHKDYTKFGSSVDKLFNQMVKAIEKDRDAFFKLMPTNKEVKHITSGGNYYKPEGKGGEDLEGYTNKSYANIKPDSDHRPSFDGSKESMNTSSDTRTLNADTEEHAKDRVRKLQQAYNLVYKYATLYQKIATLSTKLDLKCLKMWNDNNRKIWAAAVAYNRKQEDTIMMEAMMELAEYESIA